MRRIVALTATALTLTLVVPVGTAGATGQLPFRATFRGTMTAIAPPTSCPAGAAYRIWNGGWGYSTHLGRFAWESVHCTVMGPNPPFTVTIVEGSMTYVAANGDELHATYGDGYLSSLSETWACIDDEAVFTGGTGRFAGATGSAHERGCFDPRTVPTGQLLIQTLGTIAYDASDAAARS